jgi:hypothetical protein
MVSVNNRISDNNQSVTDRPPCLDSKSPWVLVAFVVSGVAGVVIIALGATNVFGSTGFVPSMVVGGVLICGATGGFIWFAVSCCKRAQQTEQEADRVKNVERKENVTDVKDSVNKDTFQKKWIDAGLNPRDMNPFLERCAQSHLDVNAIKANIIDIQCIRNEESIPLGVHKSTETIVLTKDENGINLRISTKYGETVGSSGSIIMKQGPSFHATKEGELDDIPFEDLKLFTV